MPKGRKQKTTVKKKKKSSTSKKKPIARKKKTKKRSSKAAKVSGAITASQLSAVGIEQDDLIIEDFADVSQERASIISIVRGLEGQVETAFKLKEVLEAELDATQKKLAEELDTHAQLEAQIASLEAQAALADQLREDIAFVEEERNKFANQWSQIQLQLETATDERDRLTELITQNHRCWPLKQGAYGGNRGPSELT
jgi:transposase